MSKSSILSLWWSIDLIMPFERTEESRNPKLAPKAIDVIVAQLGWFCECLLKYSWIHTITFLEYLLSDSFERCTFVSLVSFLSFFLSLYLFYQKFGLYIYFKVQQSKHASSHSCLVIWMLPCLLQRVHEAKVSPWGQNLPSCEEGLLCFSHFLFAA